MKEDTRALLYIQIQQKPVNPFTVSTFKESMKGVYTTSANSGTFDECPMVYKPMEEIVSQIQGTV